MNNVEFSKVFSIATWSVNVAKEHGKEIKEVSEMYIDFRNYGMTDMEARNEVERVLNRVEK